MDFCVSSNPVSGSTIERQRNSVAAQVTMFSKRQNQEMNIGDSLRLAQKIEAREWWLWGFAVSVTLLLTAGMVSLTFPQFRPSSEGIYWLNPKECVRGLAALVLIFDIYTVYQHLLLQRIRHGLAEQDQLFQLITENAADMIAVIDCDGRRLYNSPSYHKVLGYSSEELKATESTAQIHPEDRPRVQAAAEKARLTGRGERLEYRIRHKDGSWRILESTASAILDKRGSMRGLVVVNRDISERKHAEDLLAHNALHDALTNLPNRMLFLERVRHALSLSQHHPTYKFAVLFIDIDEFRIFNDSLGHRSGDELLLQIATRLTTSIRGADTVSRSSLEEWAQRSGSGDDSSLARLGGDEFTVLLEDIRDSSDAIRVAERIQQRLAQPFRVNSQDIITSASIGVVFGTPSYGASEEIVRDSEIAMYRAKKEGKAQCRVFDPAMHASAINRLRLETELREGLERGEFQVHYQAIVSLETEGVVGFEALSRWARDGRIRMPAEFIAVADETGMIIPLNRILLQQACAQVRSWQSEFFSEPPFRISVNITPKQFALPDLAAQIAQVLEETKIDPACVDLEITENIAMQDAERSVTVLGDLKSIGVHLSIDDFGTGYSSLSRLQAFPVDAVKIDRAFVSKMCSDEENREIVRIIIMLAHNLGLSAVAEGVETAEEVQELRKLNCDLAQGYFFSRPVDHQHTKDLLQKYANGKANASSDFVGV